jgi:hypothetical protein
MDITAYYILHGDVAVIFDKKLEEEDADYGNNICRHFSQTFNCIAVYILTANIFKYIEDHEYDELKKIKRVFTFKKERLLDIITYYRQGMIVPEEFWTSLADVFHIPLLGVGYNALNDEETKKEIEDAWEEKIKKIENNKN